MGKKLSQEQINSIYQLKKQGWCNRRTAVLLNLDSKVINRFLQNRANRSTRKGRGRPRAYNTYEDLIEQQSSSPTSSSSTSFARFSPTLNSTTDFMNQPFSADIRCISPIPELPSPISYEPPHVAEDVQFSINMLFYQIMLVKSLAILQKYQQQQQARQEQLELDSET